MLTTKTKQTLIGFARNAKSASNNKPMVIPGQGDWKAMIIQCIADLTKSAEKHNQSRGKVLFGYVSRIDRPSQKRRFGIAFQNPMPGYQASS
jgi:ABC-type molybdate transport system ATPase subunit